MSHENDLTWVYLASLAPLMELLSLDTQGPFVVSIHTAVHNAFTYLLIHQAQGTTEFFELSARVRSLIWAEAEHPTRLPLDGRFPIPFSRPTADLLPNLQTLSILCASPLGATQIAPWISSSLTAVDVHITMGMDDRAATAILSALDICAPHLTWFSFTVNHEALRSQAMLHQALLSALQNMKELRVVAVPLYASPGEHLEALGAIPHLEDLTLQLVEPPSGYVSLSAASRHVESSLFPLVDDLDALEGLHSLIPLPEVPHVNATASTTNATTQSFPALRTLYIKGPFSQIIDIINNNRFPMGYLGLRLQSVQSAHEMARTMEVIARRCRHLRLVMIHIQYWTQSSWIDMRPLGAVPCVVFVAGRMFQMSNITLEMVRASNEQ